MRVNPNSPLSSAAALPFQPRATAPSLGQDQLTLGATDELSRAFQQTAAARPGEVARATALAQDPAYPPDGVVDSVSGVMAAFLSTADPSAQPD